MQIISAFDQEIMADMRIGEEQPSLLGALGTLSKATAAFIGGFFTAKLGGFVMTNILGAAIEKSGMQPAMSLFLTCYGIIVCFVLSLLKGERRRCQ